ncbi:MAG: CRISPR-associated endonuclease Cas2 [Lachnospiraceae bacterium]|nr:CRISPR-associated endonuclease Cas2 [Lachnospiraceae bacterium]
MRLLVVYDIAISESGTKRLAKTAKICEKYCTRVQDSVFEGILDGSELTKLMNDLKMNIDEKCDSVRIYRLTDNSETNNPITIGQKAKTETLSNDAFIL